MGWEDRLINRRISGLGGWFMVYILQPEECRGRSLRRRKLCVRADTNILKEKSLLYIYQFLYVYEITS